jgi:acyl-CoA thioesterase I
MRAISSIVLLAATLACGTATSPSPQTAAALRPIVVALGDSLTAGPGLDRDQTYPALLERRASAAGYRHRIINAGVTGETSSEILLRFDRDVVPDTRVLILAAGANDGLQGTPVPTVKANVRTMLQRARGRGILVLLCGMEAPPVRGLGYSLDFHRVFPDLADEFSVPLMPFLLIGVLGIPDYTLADGVHPNARGHERIADNMWPHLEPLLQATRD